MHAQPLSLLLTGFLIGFWPIAKRVAFPVESGLALIQADSQCVGTAHLTPERVLRTGPPSHSHVYVEPDQATPLSSGILLTGRSGIAHPGLTGERYDLLVGVEISSDSVVKPYKLPVGQAEAIFVRSVQQELAVEFVRATASSVSEGTSLILSTVSDGTLVDSDTVSLPFHIMRPDLVTDVVRGSSHTWFAVAKPPTDDAHNAAIIGVQAGRLVVDSIPLLGNPSRLASVPGGQDQHVIVAYSAVRIADGRVRPPAVILTRMNRDTRAVEHLVLREAGTRIPGLVRVIADASRIHLLWFEQRTGDLYAEVVTGLSSDDGGDTWSELPSIELPELGLSFTVAEVGRDTLSIAVLFGTESRSFGLAHFARRGWTPLTIQQRDVPMSTPVLSRRQGGGFQVVFGSVDGPLSSSLPSLRVISGTWGCVRNTNQLPSEALLAP